MSRPTFNWLMQNTGSNDSLKCSIISLRIEFISAFDEVYGELNSVLCITSGFKLVMSEDNGENQFHPASFEGAGEVTPEDGHLPILFFAALHKVMRKKVPEISGKLTFCNEEGELIGLEDWSELKTEYSRLGIIGPDVLDNIRSCAEAIGFVDPVYKLEKLAEDEPSMFF